MKRPGNQSNTISVRWFPLMKTSVFLHSASVVEKRTLHGESRLLLPGSSELNCTISISSELHDAQPTQGSVFLSAPGAQMRKRRTFCRWKRSCVNTSAIQREVRVLNDCKPPLTVAVHFERPSSCANLLRSCVGRFQFKTAEPCKVCQSAWFWVGCRDMLP